MNYLKFSIKYILIMVVFSFLLNCQIPEERAIDTREVAQQVKDQKPKRVTENDLQKWLHNKSNVWFAKLQRRLLKQISQKNLQNPSDSILKTLSLNPELDSLQNIYKYEKIFFLLKSDLENPQMLATLNKRPNYQDAKKILNSYPQNTEEILNQVKISPALETENFYKQENKKFYAIHFPLRVQEEMRGIWVIIYERQQAIRFFDYKELR